MSLCPFLDRWLNFTSINFLGLMDRCQYLEEKIKIKNILCTEAFLYVRYSFLWIYNRFCDLSLLHWPLYRAV